MSVASVLDANSTRPNLLTLEVTETVFVRDRDRALVVFDELKSTGVKLALVTVGGTLTEPRLSVHHE
jgi:EAL domain-containing protein (putative c-di-GMP-specific phosphodiesterase class I)